MPEFMLIKWREKQLGTRQFVFDMSMQAAEAMAQDMRNEAIDSGEELEVTVEPIEMTQEQFDKLEEFGGF